MTRTHRFSYLFLFFISFVHSCKQVHRGSQLVEQVGKILDALEESGKMANRYVFFTADHALPVGQRPIGNIKFI